MIALLFDIDGCLTLPEYKKSVLDIELMDKLLLLDIPVALITGRSDGWLRKQFKEVNRMNYSQFSTYIEFGLAHIQNNIITFQQTATTFLKKREKFITLLDDICKQKHIFFEPDVWYNDYPSHGSLWIEEKHIQLSIAENTNCPTSKVHQICNLAWSKFKNEGRILRHHLDMDVIPNNWSKARATAHFIKNLQEEKYNWYVFGDNDSDKEMMEGLSNVNFVSTKNHASITVRKTLEELQLITL